MGIPDVQFGRLCYGLVKLPSAASWVGDQVQIDLKATSSLQTEFPWFAE